MFGEKTDNKLNSALLSDKTGGSLYAVTYRTVFQTADTDIWVDPHRTGRETKASPADFRARGDFFMHVSS
jgi:hypothetical protein